MNTTHPNDFFQQRLDILYIACGAIIFFLYFYYYFTFTPIIHPDMTQLNFANKPNESFFLNMKKTFDLTMIENGYYRSRAFGYFINYIDVNLQVFFIKYFRCTSMYLPFYTVSAALLVCSYTRLLKFTFSPWTTATCFFMSCTILFFTNYQVSTYVYLRSAKLLTPSIGIFILTYTLKSIENKVHTTSTIKIITSSLILFILMTIDEQIVALCFALTGLTLAYCLFNRQVTRIFYILFSACIFFVLWQAIFGVYVFQYFTPVPLRKHPHQFLLLSIISISNIYKSIIMTIHLVLNILGGYIWGKYFLFAVLIFLCISIKKRMIYFADVFCSVFLLGTGFTIILFSIMAHPAVYDLPDLADGMYFTFPSLLFLTSILFAIRKHLISIKYSSQIAIICASLIFAINIQHTDFFYKRHTEYGHLKNSNITSLDVINLLMKRCILTDQKDG